MRFICFILLYLFPALLSCSKDSMHTDQLPDEDQDSGSEILISEVLADPKKDGAEFVELYNRSDKIIDISKYTLASTNSKGTTGKAQAISKSNLYIYPKSFKLLSKDPEAVLSQYPVPESIVPAMMENFPQLTNTEGAVVLFKNEERVDSLHYTLKMHDALIKDSKGISLERVSMDKPTNRPGNFISASATTGYATPGYLNAQQENPAANGPPVILSKHIADTETQKTLEIQFNLKEGGQMANIFIYNTLGKRVRTLVKNHRLGTRDRIAWNGFGDNEKKLTAGVYYVFIEIYNASGDLQRYKEICFLIG